MHILVHNVTRSLCIMIYATEASCTLTLCIVPRTQYSNELWNNMFAQTHWNYNWSNVSVIGGDPLRLNFENETISQWSCVVWSYRHTAYQLMRIGQIFGAAFGAAEVPNGRIRPALPWQQTRFPTGQHRKTLFSRKL